MTDKKKIIIGFALLATFILMMVLALWALQKEPSEDIKIEQIKQEALKDAELKRTNTEGFVNASIVNKPEDHFQITYQGEVDRFNIYIQTGGRNDEKFLTKEETLEARSKAESYFLKEILQTEDKEFACMVNVRVTTTGYGDFTIKPSPLSFCNT